MIVTSRLGPVIETSAMATRRNGIDRTMSTSRASSVSTMPPRKPATRPMTTPIVDGQRGGDDADEERDARAVGDADEDVAPEVVGAEPERRVRADRQPVGGQPGLPVLLVRRVTGDGRDDGAKIAMRTMRMITASEIIATRSRRSRCQASCHGSAPLDGASFGAVAGGLLMSARGERMVAARVDGHAVDASSSRVALRCRRPAARRGAAAARSRCRRSAGSTPRGPRPAAVGTDRRRGGRAVARAPGGVAGVVRVQSGARLRTAGVEPAARRRVRRRGQVAGEDDAFPAVGDVRVGHRQRREQGPRVWVPGVSNSSAEGATSTTLPRYITAIRSLTCRTTDRSWEMNT